MLEADRELILRYKTVCGVDEAGRGCLAGPVYAAAVILPEGEHIAGLNDSKKLSAKKREALYDEITARAAAWSVARASPEEVDSLNILRATFLAMRRAIEGIDPAPGYALIDGNRAGDIPVPHGCVVGGDGKYACIAAASILAKVSRDRYMRRLAETYPQYEFERHKGYGTAVHYERLRQYGPCPVHRRSFLVKMH